MIDLEREINYLRPLFDGKYKGIEEASNKVIKFPYNHIFGMKFKFNQNGLSNISGFHIDIMQQVEKNGLFDFTNKFVYESGVYSADLVYNGRIVKRSITFFPFDWSYKNVIDKIYEAYTHFIKSGATPIVTPENKYLIRGMTLEGIEIEMFMTKKGQIVTAYPVIKGLS